MSLDNINQVWVADITYIRIETCFVYLAAIMDLYSRKVIGWGISKNIDKELCVEALAMALQRRRPPRGVIHHSDRGVQYASHAYIKMLTDHRVHISMSAKGNLYENAFCESLMKTLVIKSSLFDDGRSMKLYSFLFCFIFVYGCASNPRIENLSSTQRGLVAKVKIFRDNPYPQSESKGVVTGLSCNRNKYQERMFLKMRR